MIAHLLIHKLINNYTLSVDPEADSSYKSYIPNFRKANKVVVKKFQEIRELYDSPLNYSTMCGTERTMNGKKYLWVIFPVTPQSPAFTIFVPEECYILQ